MKRRNLISMLGVSVALSACGGVAVPPVNISVSLPPEVQSIIDDATAIINKVSPIAGSIPQIVGWIEKAKGYIDSLKAGASDAKSLVSGIVMALGSVAEALPAPYGTIASAIETLLPLMGGVVGLRMAARRPTGMTPAQARMVLRS